MHAVVPFAAESPKTRLAPVLDPTERERLASAMLEDVLEALRAAGAEPSVLTTRPLDREVPTRVDDRPLSAAVNAVLEERREPVAVVMADLALATPTALEELFAPEADVVVAPGRGGGTNALVVRHPEFRVDYHGASYLDHRRRARAVGASVADVDSFRLATDVDEPDDLAEVLLHADGATRATLDALGFELAVAEGRVGVER